MKTTIFIFFTLIIFSCGNKNASTNNRTDDGSCSCEKTSKIDSPFYATNVQLILAENINSLQLNCVTIALAIASVTDLEGNEYCENLYHIECISNAVKEMKLSNKFTYSSVETQNIDITKESGQTLFFKEIEKKDKSYFEFRVDHEGEIATIKKLEIN